MRVNFLKFVAVTAFLLLAGVFLTAEEVVLNDDFQSAALGWYENDNVRIINGRYEFSNKGNAEYTWMNDTFTDGFIEAETIWLGDDPSVGYGLVFRLVDAQNFYFLWITGDGRYTVGKVVDDHAIPIQPWTRAEAIRNQGENHLRVELCLDLMNIFINGEKVAVLDDDTFVNGGYGFYTHRGAHVAYDDLLVVSGSSFELHMPRSGTMERFREMIDKTFSLTLTGATNGKIWGTDIYTDDSDIATAAVHADALEPGESGTVLITVMPGQDSYSASERKGITSQSFGSWYGSYRIERFE